MIDITSAHNNSYSDCRRWYGSNDHLVESYLYLQDNNNDLNLKLTLQNIGFSEHGSVTITIYTNHKRSQSLSNKLHVLSNSWWWFRRNIIKSCWGPLTNIAINKDNIHKSSVDMVWQHRLENSSASMPSQYTHLIVLLHGTLWHSKYTILQSLSSIISSDKSYHLMTCDLPLTKRLINKILLSILPPVPANGLIELFVVLSDDIFINNWSWL